MIADLASEGLLFGLMTAERGPLDSSSSSSSLVVNPVRLEGRLFLGFGARGVGGEGSEAACQPAAAAMESVNEGLKDEGLGDDLEVPCKISARGAALLR